MKHLNDSFDHDFRWSVLSRASKDNLKSNILEVYYIKTWKPSLNMHMKQWSIESF